MYVYIYRYMHVLHIIYIVTNCTFNFLSTEHCCQLRDIMDRLKKLGGNRFQVKKSRNR